MFMDGINIFSVFTISFFFIYIGVESEVQRKAVHDRDSPPPLSPSSSCFLLFLLFTHRDQTFQPPHPRLVSPPAPPLPPSLPRHPSVQTHASSLQLIHSFPHLQPRLLSIQRVTFTSSLRRHHAVEIPNQEWRAGKTKQNKKNWQKGKDFVFFPFGEISLNAFIYLFYRCGIKE